MFQCYYQDKEGIRCQNRQDDCWCSIEHKDQWQAVNYIDKRGRQVRQVPINEIKRRLLEKGKEATLNDKTGDDGQLLIIPKSVDAIKKVSLITMLDH